VSFMQRFGRPCAPTMAAIRGLMPALRPSARPPISVPTSGGHPDKRKPFPAEEFRRFSRGHGITCGAARHRHPGAPDQEGGSAAPAKPPLPRRGLSALLGRRTSRRLNCFPGIRRRPFTTEESPFTLSRPGCGGCRRPAAPSASSASTDTPAPGSPRSPGGCRTRSAARPYCTSTTSPPMRSCSPGRSGCCGRSSSRSAAAKPRTTGRTTGAHGASVPPARCRPLP
jgi:hypothetical protein